MGEENKSVHRHIEGREAWITLDRPPLNILDISMMRELEAELASIPPGCDFVILQGHGPKAFSAGAEVGDHLPERAREMLAAFHGVFRRLARADCVTIASVHGHCLGGGMELATFCDFVVAEKSAKFGQPEIKLACFPPVAMITLPQLCGFRAGMDLILTGRTIGAEEAARLGLVSRLEETGTLQQSTRKLISELAGLSPDVLRLARRTLWRMHAAEFEKQLDAVEKVYFDSLMQMADSREGLQAFLERRAPVWGKH